VALTKARRPEAGRFTALEPPTEGLPGLISYHSKSKRPENQAFGKGRRAHVDRNAEARIQGDEIVPFIRTVAPQVLLFHCPNGGYRTPAESARFKWQGVLAGIPDLILVLPGGRVRFIEVKTATGRLSPAQREIHGLLVALGSPPAVCRSIDDVRRALVAWGVVTREAKQ
jgi:hypothetical protein